MIIKENVVAEKISNILKQKQAKMSKEMKKLALGEQISSAADDASGLAISEKMRAQIRGLNQAIENSEEGQSFLKTGEGALAEVEEELQRMREMAVRSANGTYTQSDREAMQNEFSQLGDDIDRIAKDTEFNTIPIFEYDEPQAGNAAQRRKITAVTTNANSKAPRMADVIANTKPGEFNLIYDEVTYDFSATQTPTGNATTNIFDGTGIKGVLKNEMIPNVVQNILAAYPAFSYLNGSSLGIGLNLYSDPTSNTLASVSASVGGNVAQYKLSINMATVNLTNPSDRSELERTIAHEMIHAFMDEATTAGMTGADRFPLWFIEGMAQSASGPGNWVAASGGLGLNAASSNAQIQTALQNNSLTNTANNASNYGTGYLATMYLGYKANGGGAVTAQGISNGLSKIMAEVIDGKSLNTAFSTLTGNSSVGNFAAGFATDPQAQQFVRDLLAATGSGAGGVVSGDLTDTDLVSDLAGSGPYLNLFELDTTKEWVSNDYTGTGVNVNSGGGVSSTGSEPIAGYDPLAIPPVGGVTASAGDFSITTAVTNGYTYDPLTKTLTITAPGNYSIAMNSGVLSTADHIKIADGVNLILDGVVINSNSGPALTVDNNATAQIALRGNNILTATGAGDDGIHSGAGTNLTINGDGKLEVSGTANGIGGGAQVKIQSGTVIAKGTTGKDIDSGGIVIEGGSVVVNKSNLNPVQPTINGTTPVYQHVFGGPSPNPIIGNAKTITIGGKTFPVSPDATNNLSLWMEGKNQTIDVTDVNGVKKTYILKFDPVNNNFSVGGQYPDDLFQVNGKSGTDASDPVTGTPGCSYDPATGVLTINQPGNFTISGGTGVNILGANAIGKIVIAPGITGVNLIFDGIDIDQSRTSGAAAMTIGTGAKVDITLKDGSDNKFISGANKAGLEVTNNADLTIRGGVAGTGKLFAQSTSNAAGIGTGYQTQGGNIYIYGGQVTARGSSGGAGIGAGNESTIGDIEIHGGTVLATTPEHGAGIGGGWSPTRNGKITITGGTVTASSASHGTGIGAGCMGSSGPIIISGGTITASGGDYGAGIGASQSGSCGDITISSATITATGGNSGAGIGAGTGTCGKITINSGTITAKGGAKGAGIGAGTGNTGMITINGGTINAEGGQYGAGIGSGERGRTADITITGGTVTAKGSTDATGIGSGRWATGTGTISVTGGSVTAIGGMVPAGYDIGVFTDSAHTNPIPIVIGSTTVQSGTAGEGKFNTTGATAPSAVPGTPGTPIFAFPLDLNNVPVGNVVGPPIAPLTVTGITSNGVTSNTPGSWQGTPPTVIGHVGADGITPTGSSYIWMTGENQTVTVTLSDGSTRQFDLVFYPDSGIFRLGSQPAPPVPPQPGNPSNPNPPIPPVPPVVPPAPLPDDPIKVDPKGLILQIGANSHQIMILQRFWLSMRALELMDVNISTQNRAQKAIGAVDKAIHRVSAMRGEYGAMHNRLDRVINGNETMAENLTEAESRIRDTDVAKTMMNFQLLQIQSQAAQSMLAQANQLPGNVLKLLE